MNRWFALLTVAWLNVAPAGTLAAQATPARADLTLPGVPVVSGEDAAAATAADMVQTILAGEDDAVMWDALAATLEERAAETSTLEPEGLAFERGLVAAGSWVEGVLGAVRGTHSWTLERAVGVLIGLLLVVALVSSLFGAARRLSIRVPRRRRRRPPEARDAVHLAKRLGARRA
ncbi:MAG: hypothetical protein AAF389_13270 [Gemmatimonadota bacterium]